MYCEFGITEYDHLSVLGGRRLEAAPVQDLTCVESGVHPLQTVDDLQQMRSCV